MRMATRLFLTSLLFCTINARICAVEPEGEIRISKLSIISDNLSETERQRLVSQFDNGEYPRDQLRKRIQVALMDLGYFKAVAEEPQFSFVRDGEQRVATVSITVHEGKRYYLKDIEFANATQFPSSRLRQLFPIREGAPFSNKAIGTGLDRLSTLYRACGYTKFSVMPTAMLDESSRTIKFTVTVDDVTGTPLRGCS